MFFKIQQQRKLYSALICFLNKYKKILFFQGIIFQASNFFYKQSFRATYFYCVLFHLLLLQYAKTTNIKLFSFSSFQFCFASCMNLYLCFNKENNTYTHTLPQDILKFQGHSQRQSKLPCQLKNHIHIHKHGHNRQYKATFLFQSSESQKFRNNIFLVGARGVKNYFRRRKKSILYFLFLFEH